MTGKRTHIPAVTAKKFSSMVKAVEKLPVNKHAKKAIQDMLVEASLPNRSDPERLGPERGGHIRQARAELAALTEKTISRASDALRALSDEEWDRLVDATDDED